MKHKFSFIFSICLFFLFLFPSTIFASQPHESVDYLKNTVSDSNGAFIVYGMTYGKYNISYYSNGGDCKYYVNDSGYINSEPVINSIDYSVNSEQQYCKKYFNGSFGSPATMITYSTIPIYSDNSFTTVYRKNDSSSSDSSFFDIGKLKGFFDNVINAILSIPTNLKVFFDSIVTAIVDLPKMIFDGFEKLFIKLFVVKEGFFDEIKDLFYLKFPIIQQILNLKLNIENYISSGNSDSFSAEIFGCRFQIVNLEFFVQYKSLIHGIIVACVYMQFFFWLIKFIPNLIRGL